ncbi:MAG TPA: flagellar export protein FliJ [Pirellulales bacterium]|nr:flagellar export protein FliJ [Pirellulales bacterium]
MARFQFRLATLLKLREAFRDERRAQLAEALRLGDELQLRRDEIEELLREAQQSQAVSPGAFNVDRLLDATRYDVVLRVEKARLEGQQASVAAEIEKRREALVAADREVRSLELLRETQRERHNAEEETKTRKELDEIASRRYAAEMLE